MGFCVWHARVKCVWESVAQLKCLSLMGMTLPSAVQPSCVGIMCLCIFVLGTWIFSQWFIFSFLLYFWSPAPSFSLPFHTTSKGWFVSSVANRSSSPQTWATSYKCHVVWLRHCRRPLTSVCLSYIQNKKPNDGNNEVFVFFWIHFELDGISFS